MKLASGLLSLINSEAGSAHVRAVQSASSLSETSSRIRSWMSGMMGGGGGRGGDLS